MCNFSWSIRKYFHDDWELPSDKSSRLKEEIARLRKHSAEISRDLHAANERAIGLRVQLTITETTGKLAELEIHTAKGALLKTEGEQRKLDRSNTILQEQIKDEIPYDGYCPVENLDVPVTLCSVRKGRYMDWDDSTDELRMWSRAQGEDLIHQRFIISRVNSHFYIKWVGGHGKHFYLQTNKMSRSRNIELTLGHVGSPFVFERQPDSQCYIRLADRPEFAMSPDLHHQAQGAEITLVPNGVERWIVKPAVA